MLSASTIVLSFGLLFANLAAATPTPRASCGPSFEGGGVSIVAGSVEWSVSSAVAGTALDHTPKNDAAEWHVQQTGTTPPTYLVKDINNNELVVGIGADGLLTLEQIDATKPTQMWAISCDSCSSGASSAPGGKYASGCKIISASTGACAEVQHAGAHISTNQCAPVVAQNWDFGTAP
ncbi:hypothetical protein R3P38DRAFT_2502159 [Favolaschia claudopus]|uniref:Ricin B lectin domain-containing protein n=1 Tax=Favolaschia claudopus TaxID=2862362 RepID=A0AAW0DM50_9AGAR